MVELVEVTDPGLAYMCLGGFVVAFSMISLFAREKLYLNEVILGTAFGVLMGPHVAGVFDPRSWTKEVDAVTLEVMRVVLATGLFAIGVELPRSYMAKHAKSLLVMIVPTMAIGWIIVGGLIKALFPALNFISCLAIASCLTPTDPIICAAIVGGKFARMHVPLNLRQLISAESAANDGLAYPFLTFAIYLTIDKSSKEGIGHWILIGVLYQVILGVFIGAILGYLFSKLMKFSHQKGLIDRESYVAQYLALAIFVAGLVSTIGSDDLLAAFAAGNAISWDGDFNTYTEGELFASVIDLVLNCACFIYIGAWLPFESFNTPELGITPWRLSVLCVGILILRRIPALLVLYKWIPEIRNWKEALFTGHFGPMGVGAVFVSTLAVHKLPAPHNPPESQQDLLALVLQPMVTFVVLGSIIIHGLSIPFFNMGRKMKSRTPTVVGLINTLSLRVPTTPEWLTQVRRFNPLDIKLGPTREVNLSEALETPLPINHGIEIQVAGADGVPIMPPVIGGDGSNFGTVRSERTVTGVSDTGKEVEKTAISINASHGVMDIEEIPNEGATTTGAKLPRSRQGSAMLQPTRTVESRVSE
ncbi:hypothetical protein AMATHDRAFT_192267 [Amanita thiersii Skay4041]|uniref:Cation/H+ exchanger transmembrane domain-containing protein n=1 Tax=Amanita thiersii Skay4041 TaxID=703135 RepID=A0A2A9NTI8_9AGAR|nr:hypothetical protein AMATHDRAFT_192267 [Amanita thiersii Skay4041]